MTAPVVFPAHSTACPTMIVSRGDVTFFPVISGQRSTPSIGNTPGWSSAGSTPASSENVWYQSEMWVMWVMLLPRTARGSSSENTNAAARIPPSNSVAFPPLNGAFPPTVGSPPLSLAKTNTVFCQRFSACSFEVRFPTSSSATLTMPWSVSRSLQNRPAG